MRPSTFAAASVVAFAVFAPLAVACGGTSFTTSPSTTDTESDDAGVTAVVDSAAPTKAPVTTADSGPPPTIVTMAIDSGAPDADDDSDADTEGPPVTIVPTAHHPTTTPPTKTCAYTPDSDGFFTLTSPEGSYAVHLPKSYDRAKPTAVMIGAHGCNDEAYHFCTWAMHPYNDVTNAFQSDTQNYISVSVEDAANGCWDYTHGSKIIAALDDLASCFYVDQSKVTIAGYSSGAAAAYYVGLSNSERFNGILIEDGALYDTGTQESSLLAGVKWPINIGHMAHNEDPLYPLAQVEADWKVMQHAGLTINEMTEDGDHSGTYEDWSEKLAPLTSTWTAPE